MFQVPFCKLYILWDLGSMSFWRLPLCSRKNSQQYKPQLYLTLVKQSRPDVSSRDLGPAELSHLLLVINIAFGHLYIFCIPFLYIVPVLILCGVCLGRLFGGFVCLFVIVVCRLPPRVTLFELGKSFNSTKEINCSNWGTKLNCTEENSCIWNEIYKLSSSPKQEWH